MCVRERYAKERKQIFRVRKGEKGNNATKRCMLISNHACDSAENMI